VRNQGFVKPPLLLFLASHQRLESHIAVGVNNIMYNNWADTGATPPDTIVFAWPMQQVWDVDTEKSARKLRAY
jgi:hypothetical protein